MFDPIKANLTVSFKSTATFVVPTVSSDDDRCNPVVGIAELLLLTFLSLGTTAMEVLPPDS